MKRYALILSVLLASTSAHAAGVSCPALADPATYAKDDSYKILTDEGDGWLFRSKDFGDNFKFNGAMRDRFTRLNAALEKQNIKLVIALLPTRAMMHEGMQNHAGYDRSRAIESYKKLAENMEATGITVASLNEFSGFKDYFYKRDHHWTASGAKHMAGLVAEEIKKMDAFKDVPKMTFKTEAGEDINHMGTFAEFAEKACGMTIEPEKVKKYSTFAQGGADDLTGDAPAPEIILVGTSNSTDSASRANFDGFLKEAIGADVDNRSVSGGGVDSAILNWLASPDYQARKPKIVVWEFPVYQDYDSGPFYQQLIPAVYGDCGDKALLSGKKEINGETVDLFDNIEGSKLFDPQKYLALHFSDLKERKFRVTMEYADGEKRVLEVRRDKKDERYGKYFFELAADEDDVPLKKVSLRFQKAVGGTVEGRFCEVK